MTTCRTSTTTGSRTDPSVPAGKERDRFRAVPLLFCPCAPGACRALISMRDAASPFFPALSPSSGENTERQG